MIFIRKIFFYLSIAFIIALVVWVSHFYRFPQQEVPIVILGSGIILGLFFRMGSKAIPVLLVSLLLSHYYLIGYSLLISVWISSSMLISGWLAFLYIRRTLSQNLLEQPVRNYLHFYVAAILISPITNLLLDLPLLWVAKETVLVNDIRLLIFSYTLGETLGTLVFAPAIILFGRQFQQEFISLNYSPFTTEKILWLFIAALLVILTVLIGESYFFAGLFDVELLLYPMVVWSALRLGVKFTNIAVAIMAYTIFTFHFFGISGTSGSMSIPQVLGMLILIVTLAVLAQLVAAINLERLKKEGLLEYAALHDPVTELPNIRSLHKDMADLMLARQENSENNMLGYISICDYEALVHGYGIEAKNLLYRQFGHFLQQELQTESTIYRVSGPAFALLFKSNQKNSAMTLMESLTKQLRHFKFIWQQQAFHINAVFSLVPVDFVPGELHGPIEHASTLADKAYEQGNIGIVIASDKDEDKKQRKTRADWLGKINETLAKDRFILFAQPIVPIQKTSGSEATLYFEILLRMKNTDGNLGMSADFISHAESFNLMPNIDRWVVRNTLKWLSSSDIDIQKIGLCSINLSGQSVADLTFCSDIEGLIQQYNVPPQKLCFEITETTVIANMYTATTFVAQLQKLGCSVALDDFGSGLSSFEYLKKLSVDILKIDGFFIQNMLESETDTVIVDAIGRVAQVMNLKTVAEFVESEEVLKLLTEMGVTYAQGFYTGRPAPLEEILLIKN